VDSGVDRRTRMRLVRAAAAIGLADGVAGVSFGAVSRTSGLTVAQTVALALLMVTGSGQFAFVGTLAAGAGGPAAVGSAMLASCRNTVYSVRLAGVIPRRWRVPAAQWVMDETAAAALGERDDRAAWWAFRAVGAGVESLWVLGTLAGAVLVSGVDPARWGLDAVAAVVFLALIASRLRQRENVQVAVVAGLVTLAVVPLVPSGVPALVAAAAVIPLAVLRRGPA